MDSNMVYLGLGIAGGITLADFVQPLWQVSRKSGVPVSQLHMGHSLSLDTMLTGYSRLLPFYERNHIVDYLRRAAVNTRDVESILYGPEPLPNSWLKMYERSRIRKARRDQVYTLPEIKDFITR